MSSSSPSPSSSPTADTPNSTSSPPPTDSSVASPPPTVLNGPNATSDAPPPTTLSDSSPPPAQAQSPPPAVTSAPPPVSPSPPPPTPVVSSPEPPTSPPTITPSPPPPAPTTPVVDPPSSPPPAPPAPVVSPPPPNQAPPPDSTSPPAVTSPPPQEASPPPPAPIVVSSPPPPAADSPPPPVSANSPPPPASVVSSPPPPADASPPLSSSSPPPSLANPPESPPATPSLTPPPPSVSQPISPPVTNSPPPTSSPPVNETQPRPSSPSPPSLPPTVPRQNDTSYGGSQPIPTQPNEVPTNGSTNPTSGAPDNGTSRGSEGGGMPIGTAVAIGIVTVIVLLGVIGLIVWYKRRPARRPTMKYNAGYVMPHNSPPVSESYHKTSAPLIGNHSGFVYSPTESGGLGNSKTWFTYEELVGVTNGFSNLLGQGGFGCVYKGILNDGREVAVKQLKIGSSQGEREFAAEVEIISRVHHRHLVSLVGYCMSEQERLLVYDFVPNETLHYHLHESTSVMDWATRLRVAIGAARGIAYLHEDCHPRIIHRDIKSSNILLDNNFEAQVSDFGLAKLALAPDATHITTRVVGTFGYMAPEYASSGKLTEKSDVYSFGVVLLELITGRKPVEEDENLVEWARPLMSDAISSRKLDGLIDPKLENYVESEVIRMLEAASVCVRHSAVNRPSLGQVVRALDDRSGTDSSDLTNGIKPGQSEVFNSAQQSAEIRMFQRMAFGDQGYSSDMFSRNSWESQRLK